MQAMMDQLQRNPQQNQQAQNIDPQALQQMLIREPAADARSAAEPAQTGARDAAKQL